MNRWLKFLAGPALLGCLALSVSPSYAQEPAFGPELQGFEYPYPVQNYSFQSQRQSLHMAYMDVMPARPNGRIVVLLHGKNFCAATWKGTIAVLADAGFRVIAPDQIGFCKSAKPQAYQFTFRQLSQNTHELLESLEVRHATLIGHSTGGMLAAHYALLYRPTVDQLIMVNPIGLEDWSAKGLPPISVDRWYERELKTTAESIRNYERTTYYAGQWRESYEPWVQMLAGLYRGPAKEQVAWNSALLDDMIVTQPVVYRFGEIKVPTLLMIGDKDTTAVGRELVPAELRAALGHYPELGRQAASAIPGARLIEFPDLGHAPQVSDPDAFHKALLLGLSVQ